MNENKTENGHTRGFVDATSLRPEKGPCRPKKEEQSVVCRICVGNVSITVSATGSGTGQKEGK